MQNPNLLGTMRAESMIEDRTWQPFSQGTSLEFVPKRASSEQNVVSVSRERVARRDSRRAIAEKLRQGLCSLAQEEF